MLLVKILLYAFALVIFTSFFEKLVRRWLGIEKVSGSKRYANRSHRWGATLIGLSFFIITLFYLEPALPVATITVFFVAFVGVSYGFDAFMQWKFLVNSREYIITIITGVFSALLVAVSFPLLHSFIY